MDLTEFVSSTGSRLAAMVWPGDKARPIVLVHGLASNARTWTQVAEMLNKRGAHVVAYDQRSHGQSDRVDSGFDFVTYADDLQLVISATGTAPPVTVGQSWGGNVVIEHAARYPTKAAIGIDGGFIDLQRRFATWDECAGLLAPPRFEGTTSEAVEGYIRASHPDWSDEAVAGTLANFAAEPDGQVRPYLKYEDHMRILKSLWDHEPMKVVPTIPSPTCAVLARPGMASEEAVRQLGFDTVALVDGDHDLHLQHPAVVANLIWETAAWDH